MKDEMGKPETLADLRHRAKVRLLKEGVDPDRELSPREARAALHELRTHEIELEMQNDELRRAQGELETARDRFSDLFDFAPVGYVTVSARGLVVEANLTLADMVGVNRSGLIQRPFSSLVLIADQDVFYRHRRDLLATGQRRLCELRLRCNDDGASFWVELDSRVVEGERGGAQMRLAVSDITARRRAQAEREALEDARRIAAEAEAATHAKSQFLANMSHEIRTPMNGVMGIMSLLLSTELTAEQRSYVETGRSSASMLMRIIDDILDFSKIEAGELDLESVVFDPRSLVEQTLESFRFSAHEKGLELSCRIGPEVSEPFHGDPLRLRQVLINLVNNAIKFTSDGAVTVCVESGPTETRPPGGGPTETRPPGGGQTETLRFAVSDTGVGIAAARIDTLFDAFTQADVSTTRQFGGTGLGLSIVNRLVRLMGGEIEVVSTPGEGSTFSFTVTASNPLPLDLPGAATENAGARSPEPARGASPIAGHGQPWRILVADDDRTNQTVLRRFLEKYGCHVDIADDGRQVLAALKQAPYDLVFMDCQMPEMDGYEATRAIRGLAPGVRYRQVPIIAVTAHAMQGEREKCFVAGMDDYITKPIMEATLADVLKRWLPTAVEVPG